MLADAVTSPPPLMPADSCVFRMIVSVSAAHGVMGELCFPRHGGQWGEAVSRTRNLVDQMHYYKMESKTSSNTVKPLLSGPPIKQTPSIKRTLSRVPKLTSYISLYN